jgi:hypothetical protein
MSHPAISVALSVLVCSAICSAQDDGGRREKEERAVEAVTGIGGSVMRDEQRPGSPVTYLSLSPEDDQDLQWVVAFSQLEELSVYHTGVTDAGLAWIGRCTQLKSLSIYNASITEAGLAHLAGLAQLKTLRIDKTPITDASLVHIAALPQLEHLWLYDVPITDAGLVHLARCPNIRWIHLYHTSVTNAGVNQLKEAQPYAIVQAHRDIEWHGLWKSLVIGLVTVAGLGLMVRQATRARRPWVWKTAVTATLVGVMGLGLMRLAPIMSPVKNGDAGTFWLRVTKVDVGAKMSDSLGSFYHPRDGWFIYYDSGFHGQFLYRVEESEVRALFPKVIEKLRNAPAGRLREDVDRGFQDWLRTGGGPDDVMGFLEKMQDARFQRMQGPGRSVADHIRERESELDERWARYARYSWNQAFEFAFLSALIVFAVWPWFRGPGRICWGIHLGLLPTLLFLPYWLGYAQYSLTSAGPSGGVLYPWLIIWLSPLRDLPWAAADGAIVQWFPRPLEPLSQTLGPMWSLSRFGTVGPVSTMTLGVVIFAAVVYGPRAARWLFRDRKKLV